MDMLTLILGASCVMWYVIDRFKELWNGFSFGKYITIFISAVFSAGLVFGFRLDFFFAVGLTEYSSLVGNIATALILMSGSSAISEIIGRIKGE